MCKRNQTLSGSSYGMKWHKFLLFFLLLSGIVNLVVGGMSFITLLAVDATTAIILILSGAICVAQGVFNFVVHGRLKGLYANGPKLLVSFGIFSVIRIVRPALLLVQATDYSVPDKECTAATNNENPCDLFRTIAFPVSRFQAQCPHDNAPVQKERGCGCGNNK